MASLRGVSSATAMQSSPSVFIEFLAVGTLGIAIGLTANGLSPQGLSLGRDYFLLAEQESLRAEHSGSEEALPPGEDTIADDLRGMGLGVTTFEEAKRAFEDPSYGYGLTIFIDARDESHYARGHIPGAWLFDHYRPERTLAQVTEAVAGAIHVIVYCNGGDCEDSTFAALTLKPGASNPDGVSVFVGGMTEWLNRGMPVELGDRMSGKTKEAP